MGEAAEFDKLLANRVKVKGRRRFYICSIVATLNGAGRETKCNVKDQSHRRLLESILDTTATILTCKEVTLSSEKLDYVSTLSCNGVSGRFRSKVVDRRYP